MKTNLLLLNSLIDKECSSQGRLLGNLRSGVRQKLDYNWCVYLFRLHRMRKLGGEGNMGDGDVIQNEFKSQCPLC